MKFIERGRGRLPGEQDFLLVGRLLFNWPVPQPSEAPLLDGGRAVHTTDEGVTFHYGALVLRRPGRDAAVSIGWRGARIPNPARWRPRFVLGQLRWRLTGSPEPPRLVAYTERSTLEEDGPDRHVRHPDRRTWPDR